MPTLSHTDVAIYTDSVTWDLANRVRDTAAAADAVDVGGSHYHITAAESAVASESARLGATKVVTDTAAAAETVTFKRTRTVTDTAAAAETVSTIQKSTVVVTDEAAASESVTAVATGVVAETAAAADATSAALLIVVTDTAAATETVTSTRKSTATVTDSAAASEIDSAPIARTATDTAAATETVIGRRIVTDVVTDTAAATETVPGIGKVVVTVADSAAAVETASGKWIAHETIVDSAEADDFIRMPAASIGDFWTNTTTGAGATWDGLPFNSLVEEDGVLYGASVDGIARLANGVDDAGTKVTAEVLYDLTDMQSVEKKRLSAVYVEAASDGQFDVSVACRQGRFVYRTTKLNQNDLGNHRALPGRGLANVAYRFGITATKDFSVNRILVPHEIIARRI